MPIRIVHGLALAALILPAACAADDPDDPPQTHVGTCTHYQSGARVIENVPNCLMRTRNLMLNGLAPATPGSRS